MDANARPRPSLESKYELLYRLMVIAALAVIMVSLVGIVSLTGIMSHVGDVKPSSEVVPDKRGNDAERANGVQPSEKQPMLRSPQTAVTVGALPRVLPAAYI